MAPESALDSIRDLARRMAGHAGPPTANDQIDNVIACIDEWRSSDRRGFGDMMEALLSTIDWEVVNADAIKQGLRIMLAGAPADELAAVSKKADYERQGFRGPEAMLERLADRDHETYEALTGLICAAGQHATRS